MGDKFGKEIVGIFTDEPHRGPFLNGFGRKDEKKELEIKASEYSNQVKYSQTTSRHIREFAAQTGVELKKVLVGTYKA